MSGERKFDFAFSETHYNMFPELRYFMDGQAPIEDLEIYVRFQSGWPTRVAIGVCALSAYPLFHLFHDVFRMSKWYAVGLLVFVDLVVSWLLLGLIIPKIRQRQIRSALRERLLELGIITCRKCAYDMRGSPQRCPECGTPA